MGRTPEETLRGYADAFALLDVDALIPFFRLPCLFLSPQGAYPVMDVAAVKALLESLLAQARSQGYRRSAISGLEVRMLGERLAWLTGVFVRYNAAEEEIARFGFAYTMLSDGDDWKIAVATAFEAP